ncbi:MAG: Ig domain-containing protein [Lachnospira sp.]|nr:Ig domain-containing protein [Lachnospira sp.]
MYSTAWVKGKGVYWNYTYKGFSVSHTLLPTGEDAKKTYLIELLKQHPEGVVLFDEDRVTSAVNNRGGSTHAVLLTDYTDGVFYYADPNPKIASGRLPMTDTATVTIAMADRYWYVKSNATVQKPVSVGSKPANAVKVVSCTSVNLNKNKALLEEKGQKVGLTATVWPNNATNKSVVWKSSDTSVATVNSQGVVTAVGEGFVTITATTVNGGKVASCDVAVALEDIEEPEEVICLEKGITLKKCMLWYQQGKL